MTGWPYAALQTELQALYQQVQSTIAPRAVVGGVTPRYLVPLQWADGNNTTALIGTNGDGIATSLANCKKEMDAFLAAGFDSILITAAWPLLDIDPQASYYQSFYSQVMTAARARGLFVVMSSGVAASGSINYGSYTLDQIFAGRRTQAWWIASNLQPDWIICGTEVTSDKAILSAAGVNVSAFDSTYWGNHFAALMAGKPAGLSVLYGGGASPHDGDAYAAAGYNSPLDIFDSHAFPLVNGALAAASQYWRKMLTRYDAARAAGKIVACTQTSFYPEGANEVSGQVVNPATGKAYTSNDIYAREVWREFAPEFTAFQNMWQQIILKYGLSAGCAFWATREFWGGDVPYDSTLTTYNQIVGPVDKAASTNIKGGSPTVNAKGQQWASFVVTNPTTAPTISSFTASPSSLIAGASSTLSWAVAGASSVSINQGLGTQTGTTVTVTPAQTTTYTLTATNAVGSTTATVTITVTVAQPAPTISSFAASPSTIVVGSAASLAWAVANATSISIAPQPGTMFMSPASVTPSTTTTYTLTATNGQGSVTATVTVTVLPLPLPTITSFVSDKSSLIVGGTCTLAWAVTGASTVALDHGLGTQPGTSLVVTPALGTNIYTLTATNSSGSRTATATVVATAAAVTPVINFFVSSLDSVQLGGTAQLTWSVANAPTSLSISPAPGTVTSSPAAVSPAVTTTYTLTATNTAGSATASTTVIVTPVPPPVLSGIAAPASVGNRADYTLWLSSPMGLRQALLAPIAFRYHRTLNQIGTLNIAVPFDAAVRRLLVSDARLEVWRSVNGGPLYLDMETVWLLRFWAVRRDVDGTKYLELGAVSANELLLRRVVAYPINSTQASKQALADDLMKAYVRDNFTSPTDATRQMSQLSVAPNTSSSSQTVTVAAPWRVVLSVLQDVSTQTDQNGTVIWFDVTGGYGGQAFTFRTYPAVRGTDHSTLGVSPVTFSADWGSLSQVVRGIEASHEATAVYAVGQGIGAQQASVVAVDSGRSNVSPFNRRERVKPAPAAASTLSLTTEAQAALRAAWPVKQLQATVVSTPQAQYGRHWKWGDLVSAAIEGETLRCRVGTVGVHWQDGEETITATLQAV